MMADASRQQLAATLRDAFAAGNFSDITVTCGPDTYKVHKVIVCSRVDFFDRAIKFKGKADMSQTDFEKEFEEGIINLPEDEPAIIKLLMQYIYEADYDPIHPHYVKDNTNAGNQFAPQTSPHTCARKPSGVHCNSSPEVRRICPHHLCGQQCKNTCQAFMCKACMPIAGDANQLVIHANMYALADKYDVVGLKTLCQAKFELACQYFWDESVFVNAAHQVFSTTPDHDKGLRNIVSAIVVDHIDQLLKKPEIETLFTEFGALGLGVLKKKKMMGWN